jgi:hypothetical protein
MWDGSYFLEFWDVHVVWNRIEADKVLGLQPKVEIGSDIIWLALLEVPSWYCRVLALWKHIWPPCLSQPIKLRRKLVITFAWCWY